MQIEELQLDWERLTAPPPPPWEDYPGPFPSQLRLFDQRDRECYRADFQRGPLRIPQDDQRAGMRRYEVWHDGEIADHGTIKDA